MNPWLILILFLGMWALIICMICYSHRDGAPMRKKLREEERKRNRMSTPRLDDMEEIRERRYKP